MLDQGGNLDTYLLLIELTYKKKSNIVLEWHRLRICMVECVGHLYVGMSRIKCCTWARKLRRVDIRVTMIRE